MPATTFTEKPLEICKKYLAEFREGDKTTKPAVIKKAAIEIFATMDDMDKKKRGLIRKVNKAH
jgi:hypothetical protein